MVKTTDFDSVHVGSIPAPSARSSSLVYKAM